MRSRWELPLFALLMSAIMSAAIAFFLPFLNGGWGEGFFTLWIGGTALGFMVSFPVSLVAVPAVRRVVDVIMDRP